MSPEARPSALGIAHFAGSAPDALALIAPDGQRWSRGRLATLSSDIAAAFRSAGLREGDVIAILSPNCAEFVAIFLAGIQAGLAIVPINWHLADPEILFVLADSDAKLVFVHQDIGPALIELVRESAGLAGRVVCIGEHEGAPSLAQFALSRPSPPAPSTQSGRIMPYTSATTGLPKAVQFSSSNADLNLEGSVEGIRATGILPEDGNVHLCASMLYHSAPLQAVHVSLHMGHTVVLAGTWTPELLLRLIDEHRVTTTFMVPAMFIRLLKLPLEVRNRYSTGSLRFVAHGGAPCPHHVKAAILDWFGDIVWDRYGSTETFGITTASPADWRKHPGTVGRPRAGVEVKICDEHGTQLPHGDVGLIYVKPYPGFRVSYKGDPQKTARSFAGDFFCVGDLGYVNEDGYLFLCDRQPDLIISSGMNIYPAEIETALLRHPVVADCAVVAESHELLGQVPKAFIELEADAVASPALTASLLQFLGTQLSMMKLPKRIQYLRPLPRDPNGKIHKRKLRELVAP